MAKSLTVRNVPDETTDELAARAAATGRSLQEYLRAELIALSHSPDPAVLVARIRARKVATGGPVEAAAILVARDADRR